VREYICIIYIREDSFTGVLQFVKLQNVELVTSGQEDAP
jgi:hypothetical protein